MKDKPKPICQVCGKEAYHLLDNRGRLSCKSCTPTPLRKMFNDTPNTKKAILVEDKVVQRGVIR